MARKISYRKKDRMYRIWSTVSDTFITDWITREEAVAFLAREARAHTNRIIKDLKETFPHGYTIKGGRKDGAVFIKFKE